MREYRCNKCGTHHYVQVSSWPCHTLIYGKKFNVRTVPCYCKKCQKFSVAQVGLKKEVIRKHISDLNNQLLPIYSTIFSSSSKRKNSALKRDIDYYNTLLKYLIEKGDSQTVCIHCGSNNVSLRNLAEEFWGCPGYKNPNGIGHMLCIGGVMEDITPPVEGNVIFRIASKELNLHHSTNMVQLQDICLEINSCSLNCMMNESSYLESLGKKYPKISGDLTSQWHLFDQERGLFIIAYLGFEERILNTYINNAFEFERRDYAKSRYLRYKNEIEMLGEYSQPCYSYVMNLLYNPEMDMSPEPQESDMETDKKLYKIITDTICVEMVKQNELEQMSFKYVWPAEY